MKKVQVAASIAAVSDPFFRQFFGGSLPKNFRIAPSAKREQSLGAGVIINAGGYILTNNHVIDCANDVKVLLGDGRTIPARIIGTDPRTDIPVLRVDAKDLPVLVFPLKIQAGNLVLAIANPFGLNQTVAPGIVSATGISAGELAHAVASQLKLPTGTQTRRRHQWRSRSAPHRTPESNEATLFRR